MSNFKKLKFAFAQLNFHVGDIDGNVAKIIEASKAAASEFAADVVIFPELALTGYPPEDLLLRPSLGQRVDASLELIKNTLTGQTIILGHPCVEGDKLFNSVSILQGGEIIGTYHKQCLPNYQVFDEKRYFAEGLESQVLEIEGLPIALTICEDIWFDAPAQNAKALGARLLININASPYHIDKQQTRKALLKEKASDLGIPVIYAHCVGGQDELIFDGGSMVFDGQGKQIIEAPRFESAIFPFDISWNDQEVNVLASEAAEQKAIQNFVSLQAETSVESEVYQALVLGVRDYVQKNKFNGVILGLSGGIDSALTLAIAVAALGKDKVQAIMMPFRYTSEMSLEDAEKQASVLGVKYQSIPIEAIYQSFMQALESEFAGSAMDKTEENLQARCRGVLLMAISNKKGSLVLTTGNKSEMAVGYSTLYGDMAGGFDVLKDVSKTLVFNLSRYINQLEGKEVIPQRVIDRPPSAELAPDQKDEDSLPPYDILDQILEAYVEHDESAEAIIAKGFSREEVFKVLRLVDINEYKRRQAPIGIRITARAFGKDRRYPITNAWRIGE